MKEEKLYRYYMFGFNYYILLRTQDWNNDTLLKSLGEYFAFIEELELPVTQSGIELNELHTEYQELKKANRSKTNRNKRVDANLVKRIQRKLTKIDSILDAELDTKVGYIAGEKRYSLKYLTEDIASLFAHGVWIHLPMIADFDFSEAGMCLALDRYTACAFHVLRGTEDVIKLYYTKLLKKTPSPQSTWGTFGSALRKAVTASAIKPPPPEELLVNMDSLRKYYRNQTQHPVLMYSADEVQDLFALCIKTVNETIQDLLKRRLIK